jgi:CsoR family transcriptional regulator, copper-sensing transcriptional repressor
LSLFSNLIGSFLALNTLQGYDILTSNSLQEGVKRVEETANGREPQGGGDSPNGAEICQHERRSHHSEEMKGKLVTRLNRIEGQIRGVKGMIEKDTYCDDVLNQIAAIQSALNGVGKLLLEGHMKSCIVERIQSGEPEVVDELLVTIHKLMK